MIYEVMLCNGTSSDLKVRTRQLQRARLLGDVLNIRCVEQWWLVNNNDFVINRMITSKFAVDVTSLLQVLPTDAFERKASQSLSPFRLPTRMMHNYWLIIRYKMC